MSEEQPSQVSEATQALRDQVALELGRSVLTYQFIEAQLKLLVPLSTVQGKGSAIRDAEGLTKRHLARTEEFTLGTLVRELKETVFQVEGSASDENADDAWAEKAAKSDVASVRMTFRVVLTAENKQLWGDMLDKLVDERNKLVHHFYPGKLQWSSEQSLREAIAELQAAFAFAKHQSIEIERLREQLMARHQESAALLDSPELVAELDRQWVCATETVKVLDQSLAESTDAEGWLPLATAGHRVHANPQAAQELADARPRYGLKSLRDFVKASGLFELGERPTQNGKTEVYRRVRG